MRKFLALILLAAGFAHAATLSPIQLLNPAGSTAGQAIVSTGPSSAPAWGTVVAGGVAPITGNSVYANFTGSSASPIANAVPSCSTANSALKYTTSTGLSCGTTFALTSGNLSQFATTTSAQLAGVLSDETGSGAAVFGTSPTIASPTLSGTVAGTPTFSGAVSFTSTITPSQTAGIVGTTTNNNANAGSVGEYVENSVATQAITTGTITTLVATPSTLGAGDWDVECNAVYNAGAGATISTVIAAVNTTAAALPANIYKTINAYTGLTAQIQTAHGLTRRLLLAAPATAYCIGFVTYSGGTVTYDAIIRARRVR